MKASTKYTVLIFLLLTYCFSIGQSHFVVSDVSQNSEGYFTADKSQSLTTNTANFFAIHTSFEANSGNHFIPFNHSLDKFALSSAIQNTALIQDHWFKQYFNTLLNHLIGSGKADGIFPFHYHW